MLVAPTEPKFLRDLGKVSSTPELYGADFLLAGKMGIVGVQRKEVRDFLASVEDDRLGKEVAMMQQLVIGVVLIEGEWKWTDDGQLMDRYNSRWSWTQVNGLLWSIQSRGLWTSFVTDMAQTATYLSSLAAWLRKDRHSSLSSRTNPSSPWGKADNRDWAIHFLQGIPGIGPVQAAAIYDHFGGIPMSMDVGMKELQEVKGLGVKRAKVISSMFSGINRLPEDVDE